MKKINFKRRKGGGDGDWGAGLDYLLKDYWDDLDKLIENNYYNRHNAKLINFLFPKIMSTLEKAVLEMQQLCGKSSKGLTDWIKKIEKIRNFGTTSKTLEKKVIFIDATTQFLRGTFVGNKIAHHIIKKKTIYRQKEIKGLVAWRGFKKIQGIVRIVSDKKHFSKFKRGEILVTDETNASFMPLIQKAKAFITDKGGILCHAAIVAREMKKPCITGTKNATRVLKDGDFIEINANKGIIRKIK